MSKRLLLALVTLASAVGMTSSCGSSESHPVSPPPDTTGTDTTGTVQKATLKVTVALNAADSSVARALGLPANQRVVNAPVILKKDGSATGVTVNTDASGVATFSDVLPGTYQLSFVRTLSSTELSQLDSKDGDVNAIGGAASITVQAPTTNAALTIDAGRRGSLVISEIKRSYPKDPAGDFYGFGHFLELYNNSDTTIYLDGKTVVKGLPGWNDYPTNGCANEEAYRMDPLGIWSAWTYRFPGSGHDYPVAPGQAVVLAEDAIDHTVVDPQEPDLSNADFEFRGSGDVNNPQVPDMISIGVRDGGMPSGHGLEFNNLMEVVAIAEPVDTATLAYAQPPSYTFGWKRIPRDKILDVITSGLANFDYGYPICGPSVNPIFDRQRADLLNAGGDERRTMQRRVAQVLPNGRRILLRTKTSSRDFQAAAMTPGVIP